jgi:hypothetical protein
MREILPGIFTWGSTYRGAATEVHDRTDTRSALRLGSGERVYDLTTVRQNEKAWLSGAPHIAKSVLLARANIVQGQGVG